MKLGNYNFVFGLGFLKEINKDNSLVVDGLKMRAGLETILPNLMNRDVETLFDVLKMANKTETPRANDAELEALIAQTNIEDLFNEVFEAMKESNFTKEKTTALMKAIQGKKK
ncbi:tail assembly chaperone [Ignavigranum ruoffiae]|uniref:tail assembly chaperone n=1 Tax=Ignavigranum ruoffiae TaxID=89093 RepID=UPI0023549145|nr:tail assembly chaperone [Ignavigranum ruoffiae]